MVGSFGEVQVMDWGLAKVLKDGGVADEEPAQPPPVAVSVIRTVRSGSAGGRVTVRQRAGDAGLHGARAGRGDVEQVDRRADVFGLGSILCEILTGQPAYTGRTSRRGDAESATGRHGRRLRAARRLRGRRRAGRPGQRLPGLRAAGPPARRGRGARTDHGLPGRGARAAAVGRAGAGRGACAGRGRGQAARPVRPTGGRGRAPGRGGRAPGRGRTAAASLPARSGGVGAWS